jgi:hypothetical protein
MRHRANSQKKLQTTTQTAARQLTGLIRTIAEAPHGQRNHLVFWSGCRLAEMVAAGLLSRATAIGLAIEAASRAGLSRIEAQRTLESAFEDRFI